MEWKTKNGLVRQNANALDIPLLHLGELLEVKSEQMPLIESVKFPMLYRVFCRAADQSALFR